MLCLSNVNILLFHECAYSCVCVRMFEDFACLRICCSLHRFFHAILNAIHAHKWGSIINIFGELIMGSSSKIYIFYVRSMFTKHIICELICIKYIMHFVSSINVLSALFVRASWQCHVWVRFCTSFLSLSLSRSQFVFWNCNELEHKISNSQIRIK